MLFIEDPYSAFIASPVRNEGTHAHGYARKEDSDECQFAISGIRQTEQVDRIGYEGEEVRRG